MAPERTDDVSALLVKAEEAHARYEDSQFNGFYDQEWARWFAAYAVEHGICDLIGHPVTAERLAGFLADTFADFQRIEPEPAGGGRATRPDASWPSSSEHERDQAIAWAASDD